MEDKHMWELSTWLEPKASLIMNLSLVCGESLPINKGPFSSCRITWSGMSECCLQGSTHAVARILKDRLLFEYVSGTYAFPTPGDRQQHPTTSKGEILVFSFVSLLWLIWCLIEQTFLIWCNNSINKFCSWSFFPKTEYFQAVYGSITIPINL